MRLGEILIERKLITPDDLARALDIQKERSGEKLGKILVDLGFIATRDVTSPSRHERVSVRAGTGAVRPHAPSSRVIMMS